MRAAIGRQLPGLLFAVAVYAAGIVVGTQMATPRADAGAFKPGTAETSGGFWFFLFHNTPVVALMSVGILTAGLLTLFLLLFNGIMVGSLLKFADAGGELWHALGGILAHSPFEIPATLLAATIGFAPVSVVCRLAVGKTVYIKTEVKDLALLLGIALLLTVAAAMAEAWISPSVSRLIGGL